MSSIIFTKLFAHVVVNQTPLAKRNQVTSFIGNDKTNWTMPPSSLDLELVEPLAMLSICGIKSNQRTAKVLK